MAEILVLPCRFNRDGAKYLAQSLEWILATEADPGPRWPQIRTIGHSLQQLSGELRQAVDGIASQDETTPELEAFCDHLRDMACAFWRLGAIAQAFQPAA